MAKEFPRHFKSYSICNDQYIKEHIVGLKVMHHDLLI